MLKRFGNQSGFSLVELMVVVAIIGILASLAIPQVSKFQARARQSEAKTQLAAVFTAEKAFYVEYTAYHSAFQAIGYSPEGTLRYNVGFDGVPTAAAHIDAGASNGYTTVIASPAYETKAYCGTSGVFASTAACATLNGVSGAAPTSITYAAAAGGLPTATCGVTATSAFTACATAYIFSNSTAVNDAWTIDQQKEIKQTSNGIP